MRLGVDQKLHILNMGAGVESCAIWAEWYFNPASRPFDSWDQLIVIMAQTGDEHVSTKRLMEEHILPQMRELGVRFIQVAKPRKGLSSQGYIILEDSRDSTTLHIRDPHIDPLSEGLENAGTTVARSEAHYCAQRWKGIPIDRFIVDAIYYEVADLPATSLAADLDRLKALGITQIKGGVSLDEINVIHKAMCDGRGKFPEPGSQKYRTALVSLIDSQLSIGPYIGYNAEETKRVAKSHEYDFRGVTYIHPLVEWGWTRADCLYKLWHHYGVIWKKSACWHCPYCNGGEAGLRWLAEPEAGAKTLWLQYKALLLNPNMELYNGGSAMDWAMRMGSAESIKRFEQRLAEASWRLWWVRRTVATRYEKGELKKSIKRSTTAHGLWRNRDDALAALRQVGEPDAAGRLVVIPRGGKSGGDGKGKLVELEAMLVVAPDDMKDKVHHEKSFEENWAIGGGPQVSDLIKVDDF